MMHGECDTKFFHLCVKREKIKRDDAKQRFCISLVTEQHEEETRRDFLI